jgi:hypothetical protein
VDAATVWRVQLVQDQKDKLLQVPQHHPVRLLGKPRPSLPTHRLGNLENGISLPDPVCRFTFTDFCT